MCDNYEFEDDDDILLSSVCTPPNENSTPLKRLSDCNDENNEHCSLKKRKVSENALSPELRMSQNAFNGNHHVAKANTPSAIKRIFPGPAGILSDDNITITPSQIDVYSQHTSSIFQDGPWAEMSKDFKISTSIYLYDKFNIAWIKKESNANQFAVQKAPFLASVLVALEVSDGPSQKSVTVTLKDMTGTIQGNIVHSFYEEFPSYFVIGSILILEQFGVLSCTCDKCDNHHLTITPKNLSAIYGKEKIVIKTIDPKEVLTDFYRRRKDMELSKSIKNQKLVFGRSPIMSNNKCGFSKIHQSGMQNKLSPTYNTPQKKSTENSFLLPKHKSLTDSVENGFKIFSVSDAKLKINYSECSKISKKLFSFKKVALPEDIHNRILDTSQGSENCIENLCSNSNFNISNTIDRFSESAIKSKIACNNKTIFSNNVNSFLHDSKEAQIPLTKATNDHPQTTKLNNPSYSNQSDESIKSSNPEVLKIADSKISIKVDKVEDEEVWKDVLGDVDLTSFFDEDF